MARALLILECMIEYVKGGVPYIHIVDEIVWKQLRHRNPFRVEDLAHPIKRSIEVSPQPFRRYISLRPYSLHRLGSKVPVHFESTVRERFVRMKPPVTQRENTLLVAWRETFSPSNTVSTPILREQLPWNFQLRVRVLTVKTNPYIFSRKSGPAVFSNIGVTMCCSKTYRPNHRQQRWSNHFSTSQPFLHSQVSREE